MANMVKWDPFQDMTRFFEEVDKLFGHFLNSFSEELYATQMAGRKMNLQVKDDGKELLITADIPDSVKDNVDVVVRQDCVVISGEARMEEKRGDGKEYHWSKFTRACSLPAKVRSEGARVTVENGKVIVRALKE